MIHILIFYLPAKGFRWSGSINGRINLSLRDKSLNWKQKKKKKKMQESFFFFNLFECYNVFCYIYYCIYYTVFNICFICSMLLSIISLSLFTFMHWRRKWQPTPVFLPGESHGQGSLVGCPLWGHTESETTEVT